MTERQEDYGASLTGQPDQWELGEWKRQYDWQQERACIAEVRIRDLETVREALYGIVVGKPALARK